MNKTYFIEDIKNYDIEQCKTIENNKINLEKNELQNFEKINNQSNNLGSVIEAREFIGCVNNSCSLYNETVYNGKSDKHYMNFNKNNSNNNLNKKNNNFKKKNKLKNLIHTIILFLYLFIISILLVSCVINRKSVNLVYVLLITIILIFYEIFISFKY